jgi:hypothetical protein
MPQENDNEKDELGKQITAMIPKNLDDIIRKNRHLANLTLTTEEEISDLYFPIKPYEPKDMMNNWSLITLNVVTQVPQVMLIGDVSGSTMTRLTSNVQQIDLKHNVLITQNRSLYLLGNRNIGEPDTNQLMTICAIFHAWGFGAFLGAPNFYF